MDIYTQIRSENATKLIESPFGGRYCGPIPPRKRISFFQGIALSFFTDKNTTGENLFSGKYAFINACKLLIIIKHKNNNLFLYLFFHIYFS